MKIYFSLFTTIVQYIYITFFLYNKSNQFLIYIFIIFIILKNNILKYWIWTLCALIYYNVC